MSFEISLIVSCIITYITTKHHLLFITYIIFKAANRYQGARKYFYGAKIIAAITALFTIKDIIKYLRHILDLERIKRKILLNKLNPCELSSFISSLENSINVFKLDNNQIYYIVVVDNNNININNNTYKNMINNLINDNININNSNNLDNSNNYL